MAHHGAAQRLLLITVVVLVFLLRARNLSLLAVPSTNATNMQLILLH